VADEETSVCVADQEGTVLVEAKVASEPAAIAAFIRAWTPPVVKVGFETGPPAAWHWHELKQLGLPVVCLDARHAKAALACQITKTDRNDTFGLARMPIRCAGKPRRWSTRNPYRSKSTIPS
jgi:transposase